MGLRVQNKLEALIDKHMSSLGAAKVSLSSITTETLWRKTGRFSSNSELFRLKGPNKKSGLMLSPTHEEEITSLVASSITTYRDLPLRLYQIGRKYRDERRPRSGLLRAKEFMMKDLYTFDEMPAAALETYEEVRQAYNNFFDELKIPYTVAQADSGNMGGKLSHEYHFIHHSGEDKIWSCNKCEYVANEEMAEHKPVQDRTSSSVTTFTAISADHTTQINIHVRKPKTYAPYDSLDWDQFLNPHAIRKEAETLGIDLATGLEKDTLKTLLSQTTKSCDIYDTQVSETATRDLTAILPGDSCPKCETGTLTPMPGIEVGHTFNLGTRYSEPLNAVVASRATGKPTPVHMGCHGIGVSRLIGAVAALLHDDKGLIWPRAIAPFEAVIIPAKLTPQDEVMGVYDALTAGGIDVVIDDRENKNLGWRLKDADLVGYPVILVMGRDWKTEKKLEVQCRQIGYKGVLKIGEFEDVLVKL